MMPAVGDLEAQLSRAVCSVAAGAASGTGWLASADGIVVTAGHLVAEPPARSRLEVRFPGHTRGQPATVIASGYDPARGVDFAILSVPVPVGLTGLPISLERSPHGQLISMGYGVTLGSLSAAGGEFVGPFDPQNDTVNRLFRCRSVELAEPGYSGAPIASADSAAVVAIQVEAVTGSRGARDTVLAMPLYRVAGFWNQLEEIEAGQAASRDRGAPQIVTVVTMGPAGSLGPLIVGVLEADGFRVVGMDVRAGQSVAARMAELHSSAAVVLLADAGAGGGEAARELVVAAALRHLPIVVAASPEAAIPGFLRHFSQIGTDAAPGIVARAVTQAVTDGLAEGAERATLGALSDALEEIQARAADPLRFQPHIDELRTLVGGWSSRRDRQERRVRAVAGPGPARAAAPESLVPTAGVRPFDPEHLFRDRTAEADMVSRYLADESVGIVAVVGRAGIGKTALAAHVMAALRRRQWLHPGTGPVLDGLVYLSTRTSSGISSSELVLKLSRLVGDTGLVRSWSGQATPVRERIGELIEALADRRIVVLLDNFEDLLDDQGRISAPDLFGELLTALAEGDSGLSFLITSRERVEFDLRCLPRTRVVELRTGLPASESVRMLRELDAEGEYGLRQASGAMLQSIAGTVHGIPRALQLIVGLLASDPLLAAADLADPGRQAADEPLRGLIAETLSRLDETARWVLLILAVLGRPELIGAVDFILRPFLPGADVPAVARRLIRIQVVSVDRVTRRMALHPADRAYLLRQASEERPATLTLVRRRTAEYYLSRIPDVAGLTDIEEVRPFLFATEQLMLAGDYSAAADALGKYDGLLEYWGYYQIVIDLRKELAGKVAGDLWIRNSVRLGRLYWLTGDAAESRSWLARAEAEAVARQRHTELAPILVDLAASQRDAGDLRGSLSTFRRALRASGNETGTLVMARALIQIIHTVRPLGFLLTSLRCAERAIQIASERGAGEGGDPGATFLKAGALINQAFSNRLQGDLALARDRFGESRRLAEAIGDRGLLAYSRCGLAGVLRAEGLPARALPDLLAALEIYEEIGDRWGQAACLATLAWVCADLLDLPTAARYIQQGHSVAEGNPRAAASLVLADSVLARRQGNFTDAGGLAAAALTRFRDGRLDLYGAWASCELALTGFLRGMAGEEIRPPSGRATRAAMTAWQVARALTSVTAAGTAAEGRSQLTAAAAAVRGLAGGAEPPDALRILLTAAVAAGQTALTGDDALMADVRAPLSALPAAPGLLTDYQQIIRRLGDAGLPGSDALAVLADSVALSSG